MLLQFSDGLAFRALYCRQLGHNRVAHFPARGAETASGLDPSSFRSATTTACIPEHADFDAVAALKDVANPAIFATCAASIEPRNTGLHRNGFIIQDWSNFHVRSWPLSRSPMMPQQTTDQTDTDENSQAPNENVPPHRKTPEAEQWSSSLPVCHVAHDPLSIVDSADLVCESQSARQPKPTAAKLNHPL